MANKSWNATNFVDGDVIPASEMIKHSQMHGDLGTGRSASFTVAADDSPGVAKAQADYVGSGSGEQDVIQNAIDALPDRGGKIALMGHFHTNDTIHMYRDVAQWFDLFLQGEGLKATVIELANSSNCDIIDVVGLNHDVGWKGVADMMLDGNEAGQTSGHGIHSEKAGTGDLFDMRFRNVFAYDCKEDGFNLNAGWGVYLDNCLGEYCGGRGIYLQGSECYLYGFHSSANGGHGIDLGAGTQIHVSDCRVSNVDAGIRMYNVRQSVISNNTIGDFGKAGGDKIGIYITGTSEYNSIHDNIINGNDANSQYGIYYVGTGLIPDNIHHNQIDGCTDACIILASDVAETAHFRHNTITPDTAAILFWGDITNNHIFEGNFGSNPYGVRASPWDNTNFMIAPYKSALAAAPNTASQAYTAVMTPCRVISTGGTGIAIVIKDAAGTTICSPGATCDEELEIGWTINFGGFSGAPTTTVIFK